MTQTDSLSITPEAVIAYLITYDNPRIFITNSDIGSIAHLLTPDTDCAIIITIIRAGRRGMLIDFLDPLLVDSTNFHLLWERHQGDLAMLMSPGYSWVFQGDFVGDRQADATAAFHLVVDIMEHFGRRAEFLNRAVSIFSISDIARFINQPIVKSKAPASGGTAGVWIWRTGLFSAVFLIYWMLTDLKTASIVTVTLFVIWAGYRSFKQFIKDIKG